MLTRNMDIAIQRNADWVRRIPFVAATGEAIDFTGVIFELDVKYSAGAPGAPLGSGLCAPVGDPADGILEIEFTGATFAAVPGEQEVVRLAYDLIGVVGGSRFCLLRGAFLLEPGVS